MTTQKPMLNVMLDLETMGTSQDAPIVAIGAVFFDLETGMTGGDFYQVIDLESSGSYSTIDPATVKWWMKQNHEARKIFNDPDAGDLLDALVFFEEWLTQDGDQDKLQIWGNGAGFDNVILANAYQSLGSKAPWKHWNNRDVRTMVSLGRDLLNFDPKKDMPFQGEKHNALDDAKHQAKYVSAIYQRLQAIGKGA